MCAGCSRLCPSVVGSSTRAKGFSGQAMGLMSSTSLRGLSTRPITGRSSLLGASNLAGEFNREPTSAQQRIKGRGVDASTPQRHQCPTVSYCPAYASAKVNLTICLSYYSQVVGSLLSPNARIFKVSCRLRGDSILSELMPLLNS